jgi:hypothetical protein
MLIMCARATMALPSRQIPFKACIAPDDAAEHNRDPHRHAAQGSTWYPSPMPSSAAARWSPVNFPKLCAAHQCGRVPWGFDVRFGSMLSKNALP